MLEPGWREVGIGSLHASSAGGQFGGEPTWVITMDFGARAGGEKAAKPAIKPAASPRPEKAKPAKAYERKPGNKADTPTKSRARGRSRASPAERRRPVRCDVRIR